LLGVAASAGDEAGQDRAMRRVLARGGRSFAYLYLMTIFGGLAVIWTLFVVIALVKLATGDYIKDEYAFWPLAALAVVVVPLCTATRWLWRRWRNP
jgi:hypothetical protein